MNLIVACGTNGVIGKEGKLPWHLSEDLRFFKKITQDSILIMGRKTFESLSKPLENRTIVVVSSTDVSHPVIKTGYIVVHSIKHAISVAKGFNGKEIFVAGGESIYKQCMPYVDMIYYTEVDYTSTGDTYFDLDWMPEFRIMNKMSFVDEYYYRRYIFKRI